MYAEGQHANLHYPIQNRQSTGIYCMAQGTQTRASNNSRRVGGQTAGRDVHMGGEWVNLWLILADAC